MAWPTSPLIADWRYWPYLQCRLDVWKSASLAQTGGNACLLWVHGGGWGGGDKSSLTDPVSDSGYDLVNYALTSNLTAQKWTCVAINYRMAAHTAPTKNSYPSYFPESFMDVAFAVQAIKENARLYGTSIVANPKSWGINPNKIVAFGASAGATNSLITSLRRSEPMHNTLSLNRSRRFCYQSSSIPALVVNYIGVIDIRFDVALGVETFPYNIIGGAIFGNSVADGGVEWGLIPNDLKAAASPLAYLEQAKLESRPAGIYNIYFGPTTPSAKPYTSLHPSEQLAIIYAACQAKQIDTAQDMIVPGDWKVYTPTPATSPSFAISKRIMDFCEARIGP